VTGYMVTFAIAGRADNWYWGLLIAPLLPLGLIARQPTQNRPSV